MSKKAPFIVVSGPSGSGKTTLCRMAEEKLGFYYAVSHTTRPKREGEIDGKDYFFISIDQFNEMVEKGEFLEWAKVYGNFYGTSRKVVEEHLNQGIGVIVDVDTQGARNLKKNFKDAVLIFISVPSASELEYRLKNRGTETEINLQERLKAKEVEESFSNHFDYNVVNEKIDHTFDTISSIIEKNTSV